MSYQRTARSLLPSPIGATLLGLVRRLAFWAAVLLPVTYFLYGLVATPQPEALAVLLSVNVCCLVLGQGYEP